MTYRCNPIRVKVTRFFSVKNIEINLNNKILFNFHCLWIVFWWNVVGVAKMVNIHRENVVSRQTSKEFINKYIDFTTFRTYSLMGFCSFSSCWVRFCLVDFHLCLPIKTEWKLYKFRSKPLQVYIFTDGLQYTHIRCSFNKSNPFLDRGVIKVKGWPSLFTVKRK